MRLGRAVREPDETSVDTSGSGPGLSTTGRHVAVPAAPLPRPHGAPLLGELLVTVGLLTRPQLDESLLQQAESGKRLGSLLVELGAIDDAQLIEALGAQLDLPNADLRNRLPDPEVLTVVPEALARQAGAVPIGVDGDGTLEVAVSDPHQDLADLLARTTGRPVRLSLATRAEVRRVIDNTYRALSGVDEHVAAFTAVHGNRQAAARSVDVSADEAPVVQVVNKIITQALRDRASDVHIEPQDDRTRVRFRIDGALHDVMALPESMGPAITSRLKITAGMNIVERRRPQDGQIAMTIDGREIDIRVATTGVIWGEKTVLRLLDKSRPAYRLGDLGMPSDTHDRYSAMIRSPFGMVICAGPTGSGKTTTLYASMTEINSTERNITTIEDPVEYVFPSINQIQINEAAGVTFAGGLRSILRQDPDVILVGEIRDAETARIAVQSALTGHFVLSSLHGTDAVSALYRLLDMGIEPFLIASSVLGVVGQRLVRRSCPYCRVRYLPSPEELAFYRQIGGVPKDQFWAGEGCNLCSRTGYSDRIGAYELLVMTEELKTMLLDGRPSHEQMRQVAVGQGMRPLRDEARLLIEADVTTISEVVRSIYTL
jgi:type IV pilus assembly protein PilB